MRRSASSASIGAACAWPTSSEASRTKVPCPLRLTCLRASTYLRLRRFPQGTKRECGASGELKAAAAPATVGGESSTTMSLGRACLGRRWRAPIREPGDLPSAVVTRGQAGRGAPAGALSTVPDGAGEKALVRGDVPHSSPEVASCLPFPSRLPAAPSGAAWPMPSQRPFPCSPLIPGEPKKRAVLPRPRRCRSTPSRSKAGGRSRPRGSISARPPSAAAVSA